MAVVVEEFVDERVLIPQANAEELTRNFPLDRQLEASPRDEQPLVRLDVLHRADELIERGAVDRRLLRLHLDTDARAAEAEWAWGSEDIHALVGAFRAAVGGVALRLEDGLDEALHAVPLELTDDEAGDAISPEAFEVDGLFRRFSIGRDRDLFAAGERFCGRAPVVLGHLPDAPLGVVALDLAEGEERAEGVEQVLVEGSARHVFGEPLYVAP